MTELYHSHSPPTATACDRESWQVPACHNAYWLGRSQECCLVIPVINEGERIVRLLHRIADLQIDRLIDVIIIDGGSHDGSLRQELLQQTGVRCLLVMDEQRGLGAQLRSAYAFALDHGYHGIVTIDGNDKDDPRAIPHFLKALGEGLDFVQASRFLTGGSSENTPLARYLAIRLVHAPLVSLFSGFRWTDSTQGFRAYSRRLLVDGRVAPFRDLFDHYQLLAYLSVRAPRLGYRCVELPTTRRYPRGGVPTKISGWRGNWSLFVTLVMACVGRYNP